MTALRLFRTAAGLSSKELAARVGVNENTMRHWDRGARLHIQDYKITILLSEVLGCTPTEIDPDFCIKPDRQKENPIYLHRVSCGLSRDDVANALTVTRHSVCDWESGKYRPSDENLAMLAKLFCCRPEDLGYSLKVRPPVEERNRLVMEYENVIRLVLSKNRALIKASRAEYDDLYQDLALRLVQAADTFDPARGTFKTHAIKALWGELKQRAAIASAHGIKGAPRDLFPVFASMEAMQEAGHQFAS